MHGCIRGRHDATVSGAIGVPKTESSRDTPAHDKLTAMVRAMVRSAQGNHVVCFVRAAIFTGFKMMHIHEIYVAATWHLAAVLVSTQHGAS